MKKVKVLPSPLLLLLLLLSTIALSGCGSPTSPLEKIEEEFTATPSYSVILDDLKQEDGKFFEKYSVVVPDVADKKAKNIERDWAESSEKDFQNVLPFLGMTVLTKENGSTSYAANPPGYEYVNDPNYGKWEQRGNGIPIWVWFAGYSLWNSRYNTPQINYRNYENYRSSKRNNSPYFGKNNEFGTRGSLTKKTKPSFYQRKNAEALTKKSTFSSRVQKRIGRSSVAVRSRGRSGGK